MAGTIIADAVEDSLGNPFLQSDAESLSPIGYQKLSNGLILQWGNFANSSSTVSVTFPIAFPNACVSVGSISRYDNDSSGVGSDSPLSAAPTTTGMSISVATAYHYTYWIAIGY